MSKYQGQSPNIKIAGAAKGIVIGIIVLIIIGVVAAASAQIVDSGHRGVLLHWNAVDVASPPLEEGLHFVVPFQDSIVNMEVRTLKFVKETSSASKDLQTVSTEVTVNYRPDPNAVLPLIVVEGDSFSIILPFRLFFFTNLDISRSQLFSVTKGAITRTGKVCFSVQT